LNLKHNRKTISRALVILFVVIISVFFLTGCVRGMSPVGWSGVQPNNGVLYTASLEGKVVSVDTAKNNSLDFSEALRAAPSSSGCSTTSSGNGCGGSPPAVAVYGTPAIASNVPLGVDINGQPILGSVVIIAGYNGQVFAYDASTLQQRWVYPVNSFLLPIVSSITVSGNTLYFGGTDGKVYALDTATGTPKWANPFTTGGEIWSSPIVDNNTVFISSFDKKIYALDAVTGNQKWEFATQANNVATPVAANGIVYFGSLDRNLYAIDENTGKQVWSFSGGNWFWARPVITNNVIFAPNLDNIVYGLDIKTGNKLFEYNVGAQVSSWPVVVNNQLYVATQTGELFSLSTDQAKPSVAPFTAVATIPLSGGGGCAGSNSLSGPLSADPAKGEIYINNGNAIYTYNINIGNTSSISIIQTK
jgi:hypothetical protein